MIGNFYHVVLDMLEDDVPGLRTTHGQAGIAQSACIVQTLVFAFGTNCSELQSKLSMSGLLSVWGVPQQLQYERIIYSASPALQ